MSDMGTKIMAAGLCEEGIEFERLETEIAVLKERLSSNKPICPYCHVFLIPFVHKGYYEDVSGWECNCEKLPNPIIYAGGYT